MTTRPLHETHRRMGGPFYFQLNFEGEMQNTRWSYTIHCPYGDRTFSSPYMYLSSEDCENAAHEHINVMDQMVEVHEIRERRQKKGWIMIAFILSLVLAAVFAIHCPA